MSNSQITKNTLPIEEDTKNLKQKTIKGIMWNFVELFGKYGLTLLISLTLARILGPKDYGLIGLATAFFAIANAIIDGGFKTVLIRKKTVTSADYNTIFYFNLFASAVVYAAVFFLAPLIAKFYGEPRLVPLTRFIGITFFFNALCLIQQTDRSRKLNFKIQAFITLPAGLVSGAVAIYLALNGFGVWSLAVQMVLGSFLVTGLYWALNGWRPSLVFSWGSFREMFSGGVMFFLYSILQSIYTNGVTLIVGKVVPVQQLGYYTLGNKIITLSSQNIRNAVQTVTFPAFSKVQDDRKKLTQGYRMVIQSVTAIVFPLMAALFILSEPLIQLFLGEKWIPAVPYLKILCVSGAISSLSSINANVLTVKASPELNLKLKVVRITLMLSVIALLANFGMIVMLWGMVFNYACAYILNSYFNLPYMDYSILRQIRDVLPAVASSVFMAMILYCIQMIIPVDALHLQLILSVPVAGISYVVFCYLFKVAAMKQFLQSIGKRYFPVSVRTLYP
ncbi:MAG: lipopolysaccharide biosynthesis protein [Chitinispirillales bacterium]|jgi:O-antigen/teichoic acid export membrane protein|nr:lipopolysaccharide biosynthesis protein [Chitinispirillales bacterium]